MRAAPMVAVLTVSGIATPARGGLVDEVRRCCRRDVLWVLQGVSVWI